MDSQKLLFLYGSQTGTAQDIAERLWREAKYRGLQGPVLPMDEYEIQNLINERIVVFICSTTGQGDQPDNMKKFWKFLLRKSLPTNSLLHMKFAVLGLGDSSYVKFNFCAKKLYRRLLQLSAQPLVEPGYADEQHDIGIDAVVHPWISKFWDSLMEITPNLKHKPKSEPGFYPPRWSVNVLENRSVLTDENLKYADLLQKNSAKVTCISNERVTSSSHFQDTRLIKFTSENLQYIPGDVLMIKPKNNNEAVQQFFNLFVDRKHEVHGNVVVSVTEAYSDMPVPYGLQNPVLLKTIVQEYWDLNMVPRCYTFELLARFTNSDLEREKLLEFTSSTGQEELYNYCNRPKRTILEVLADFPHATAKIPFNYFFELFQPIRPRAFSIASSPNVHLGEIHILVAIVKYKTILKIPRIGLCSNWLANLTVKDEVIVSLKPGSFCFPSSNKATVIMVGPGTGIAPFRSYIHEESRKKDSAKHYLIFGCRSEKADFYFKNEWHLLQQEGKMQLYTAFSRDQSQKIYVQHIVQKYSEIFGELIGEENAYIFVAGNSKNMPNAVREAFLSSYAQNRKIDVDTCEKIFEKMELNGHYQTETWS